MLYKTKGGQKIVVTTLTKPTKTRVFPTSVGRRKFTAVRVKRLTREVIFVAKTKSKNTKKKGKAIDEPISDDELEELEELEDLDDDDEDEDVEEEEVDEEEEDEEEPEDEDEDEDDEEEEDEDEEEDDDEDDEEEEVKPKKKGKKKSTAKKRAPRQRDDGKIGSQEVAEHLGIDGKSLRVLLRKNPSIQSQVQDEESKQYRFTSLNHPAVKKLKKLVDSGAHKKAQREQFDKMGKKGKAGKKKVSTKGKTKTSTKKKSSK